MNNKRPSELLRESADPFDAACMKVREMESILERLLIAHKRSEVDWPAMKEVEQMLDEKKGVMMVDDIPRRNRIDLYSEAEKAIHETIQIVEETGAHPLLTEAVILLSGAKDRVSDFVELEPGEGQCQK